MPRIRSLNYPPQQVDLLLDSLETCPQLFMKHIAGKMPTIHNQRLAWEAVAQRLSEDGMGVTRRADQVRQKWCDMKYRTRKKANKIARMKRIGEVPNEELSEVEKRVLSIMSLDPLERVRVLKPEKEICLLSSNEASDENWSNKLQEIKNEFLKKGESHSGNASNASSDHDDNMKKLLEALGSDFSEQEEPSSENATEVKMSEHEQTLPCSVKKQRTSLEISKWLGSRKRKIDEKEFEERALSTQDRMATDINNIKLSLIEMKDSINMYMKRIDEKFDKMINLLAVALNVEPHDLKE